MKLSHLASRVAVGGVATALATAGLVGVTGTSASAASGQQHLRLHCPELGDKTFTVSVDIPLLPSDRPGRRSRSPLGCCRSTRR